MGFLGEILGGFGIEEEELRVGSRMKERLIREIKLTEMNLGFFFSFLHLGFGGLTMKSVIKLC